MIQGLHRNLLKDTILLDLDSHLEIPAELEELSDKRKLMVKRQVLQVLVSLFDKTGEIVNPSKCLTDFVNREAKATTAMGRSVAIPHVRTLQARNFLVAIMRSEKGVYFDSLDGSLVNIFVGIVSPPYEEKTYLKFLSMLSREVNNGELIDRIMKSNDPQDIHGYLCRLRV